MRRSYKHAAWVEAGLQGLLGRTLQPIGVGLLRFDDHVRLIHRHVGATEHGVAQSEAPLPGGREAVGDQAAGNDVLLQPKGRHIEAVNHVLGLQLKVDPLIDREVQF